MVANPNSSSAEGPRKKLQHRQDRKRKKNRLEPQQSPLPDGYYGPRSSPLDSAGGHPASSNWALRTEKSLLQQSMGAFSYSSPITSLSDAVVRGSDSMRVQSELPPPRASPRLNPGLQDTRGRSEASLKPSLEYLQKALEEPRTRLLGSSQLLIILDLNGTLCFRNKSRAGSGSASPTPRPGLSEFLTYCFMNHRVSVWTSTRPNNAALMIDALFTPEQKTQLMNVWARDTLGLTVKQYNSKATVYKRLERVWQGEFMIPHYLPGGQWNQTNTVLLDDSIIKASAQPYNLIQFPEFLATKTQIEKDNVLAQCVGYLEELKWFDNASSFIRQRPFEPNLQGR